MRTLKLVILALLATILAIPTATAEHRDRGSRVRGFVVKTPCSYCCTHGFREGQCHHRGCRAYDSRYDRHRRGTSVAVRIRVGDTEVGGRYEKRLRPRRLINQELVLSNSTNYPVFVVAEGDEITRLEPGEESLYEVSIPEGERVKAFAQVWDGGQARRVWLSQRDLGGSGIEFFDPWDEEPSEPLAEPDDEPAQTRPSARRIDPTPEPTPDRE